MGAMRARARSLEGFELDFSVPTAVRHQEIAAHEGSSRYAQQLTRGQKVFGRYIALIVRFPDRSQRHSLAHLRR